MSVQVVKLERPNPRQEEFLKCEKKYVAFGGARGGGKSWAVRTKAVLMALKYPGIRILLVRRTMPELESNHLRFLRRQLAGVAEYKAVSRQLVFPGGSVLELGYCACDGDMDRYQGAEFDVICIDEATQLKEEWLRQFAACLQGVNEFPKRMYYTSPVGPIYSYADVAQLAEQLICNQQVIGSSPIIGFYTISYCIYGQIPEWPKGTDCKSAANCFGGSNPPLPIGITFSVIAYNKIYYRGMEQSGSSPGS